MSDDDIRAAGTVLWRRRRGRLEVALVHRPRYEDWSWPKGKLDEGEDWPGAAAREAREETGLRIRLGIPLPEARYEAPGATGGRRDKLVHYWAATPVAGSGRLEHEVDAVRWVTAPKARRLLSYPRDARQLDALAAAHRRGTLDTWPLLVVRHAKALPRRRWSRKDWLRPLDERGYRQAADLVDVLTAYDVRRVISSTACRCVRTVAPYAKSARLTVATSWWLSEEGYDEKPGKLSGVVAEALGRGVPAALCSHGPVLPELVGLLAARAPKGPTRTLLREAAEDKLVKGEALVVHVAGAGKKARVVAAERHFPLR